MTELKDTIELMTSDNYQDRFKAEVYQLKIRMRKLDAMLVKYEAGTLDFKPNCSYELLADQLLHMQSYLETLQERAKFENIKLD
jgi:hypothetical protein